MTDAHPYFQRTARDPVPPRRRQSFEVDLIEFVRPGTYWHEGISLEQAFATMQWIMATGTDDYDTRQTWRTYGVEEFLKGLHEDYHRPATRSVNDLRRMFHRAILAKAPTEAIERWRVDHGISPVSTIKPIARYNRPSEAPTPGALTSDWGLQDGLTALMEKQRGTRMAVSLNHVHPDCNYAHGVSIDITREGFRFVLTFGMDPTDDKSASRWDDLIAATRPGETFVDTVARARDVCACLVDGKANGCDLGDLDRRYSMQPDFVLDQVEQLHLDAEAAPAMR